MRNEIVLPLGMLEAAEQLAQSLGLSSNELFDAALSDFIQRHHANDITSALDRVYATEDSRIDPVLATLQIKSLPQESW